MTGTKVPRYHSQPTVRYARRRPCHNATPVSTSNRAAASRTRSIGQALTNGEITVRCDGQSSFARYQTYDTSALEIRDSNDTPAAPSNEDNAPPLSCAITVTTHDAAESAKKGAFSATNRQRLMGRAAADKGLRLVEKRGRPTGHQ